MTLLRNCLSIVTLAAVAACATDSVGPADGSLSIAMSLAGDATDAFAKSNEVTVRVLIAGETVYEGTQRFVPDLGTPSVRVRLDEAARGSAIEVRITMMAQGAATFTGLGEGTIAESGPTQVDVALEPVVARVEMEDPALRFTAIGETGRLSGTAVFATGDTIPGVEIVWSSLDPEIVEVDPDGAAVALAEGDARIRAEAGDATTEGTASVAPVAVRITVTPRTANLAIGESTTLVAALEDRNGNAIQRPPAWTSAQPSVATVDAAGVVTGVSSGVTSVTATSDGVSASALINVAAVPPSPGSLAATVTSEAQRLVQLTWEDNAPNEEEYVVERQAGSSPFTPVASLPANTTTYIATGVPGPNTFRVLACNGEGCSAPSNETTVEFATGPPIVETLEGAVGLMAGRVDAGPGFRAWFQYSYRNDGFSEGCIDSPFDPCVRTTSPTTYAAPGEITVPAEIDLDRPFFYRIIAENEFGMAEGAVLALTIPDLGFSVELNDTTWLVSAEVTISGPSGTFVSPIASVAFESYVDGTSTSASESVIDNPVSGVRTYRYEGSYVIKDLSLEGDFVTAVIRFASGGSAFVETCVGFACSSGLRAPTRTQTRVFVNREDGR